MARSLRPARADDLGLKRALSDRLLPLLVAAMTFLAALALAGAVAATALAGHWRGGAATLVTVQVPVPAAAARGGASETRAQAAARVLAATPGIASAHRLSGAELQTLLTPWLGADAEKLSLPLPAVFEVSLQPGTTVPASLDAALSAAAPGSVVEHNGAWLARLVALVRSLQACAALALLVVAFVAAAVVAVATRAGLAARRDAIEIVHGLGATDAMISGQFAGRVTILVLSGALLGLALAMPVLLSLAQLAAPFRDAATAAVVEPADLLRDVPAVLWMGLAAVPPVLGCIGFFTAQATVRGWLAQLP
jgi:cell division transport system permease protein